MKKLILTKGYLALVDDDVYERILKLNRPWFARVSRDSIYAARDETYSKKNRKRVYLHRWIMGLPPGRTPVVDHINRDTLDNRRENLRLVTTSENNRNSGLSISNTSGFIGVAVVNDSGNWRAYASSNNKQINIGVWPTKELAAVGRDLFVKERFPTSVLNFPDGKFPHTPEEVESSKIARPINETPGIRFKANGYEVEKRVDGNRVYVGRFDTLEEAKLAQRNFLKTKGKK
jgi:hypothetical protein